MIKNRLNEESYNNQGYKMKIIKYNNSEDITVRFLDDFKYEVDTTYRRFKIGEVVNPYAKTVFGIGYIGLTNTCVNYKIKKSYTVWREMLRRCYDKSYEYKKLSYKNCTVCDEWLCYETFERWFDENYYECNDKLELDKDLKYKNNKVYSSENCILIPYKINNLFINCFKGNDNIGVSKRNDLKTKPFCAYININGKLKNLGYYKTKEEAQSVYFEYKNKILKEYITNYKKYLPTDTYNLLYSKINNGGL